ncbi:MAG TPA: RNA polymerase sigma factor [Chthoniobacterales bacterium]
MPLPELEAIYDAHAQALFAFALSLTRSEALAQDALQEIFCKLARRPQLLARARNPRAFLLRMTYHWVVDEARRDQARIRRTEALPAPPQFAASPDPDESLFRQELESALGELPPEQRAVVHLKLWGGLTFESIAETLRIPANTAASRFRYGLDKLQTRLRPLYEEIQ